MLKSEQNTPQVEQEVEQLIATHPETEIHEGCTPVFEHNQWFVSCGPCGAIWSVVDVEGGQNDLDLEGLESGDESCLENFTASDKTAEVSGVTCAKCGAKTDFKTQGHEFENGWFCDKCSKEASVEQPVSEKTAEGLFDQFGIWDKFKQWMKTNSSSQQASVEKTAFEPDANSGIRGSNDGTYIYQADVWCGNCAKEIAAELTAAGEAPEDPSDERSYDSDQFPKGPFFDEESDAPEHCSGCHIFLENPLTTRGQEYMQQMVDEAIEKGRGEEPHIKEWMDFYGYHGPEVEEEEADRFSPTKESAIGDGGLEKDVQKSYDSHPVVEMLWDYLKRDPEHKDRVQTAWGTKTRQGLVFSVARIMKESPLSGKEASKKTAGHKHTCPECGKSLTCNNPKDCPGEGKKALCGACPKK